MKATSKLIQLVFVLGCAATGAAFAAPGNKALEGPRDVPLSKAAYEAASQRIEAQARADRKACRRLKGERREVCDAEAKGKEDAALAKLEARWKRTPEAIQEAKEVTADANYRVAREKCEALEGDAHDRCVDEAKAAREAAIRQARVEKVDSTGGVFGRKDASARKAAAAGKS
jgi:hypothetical protein